LPRENLFWKCFLFQDKTWSVSEKLSLWHLDMIMWSLCVISSLWLCSGLQPQPCKAQYYL
jgi:hypothetical protein